MALTSDQINRLTADFMNGRPPRDTGPEADRFLKDLAADVAKIKAQGGEVEIPVEQPDQ